MLEGARQPWTMFSKLKVLVDLEKFQVIFLSIVQKTITWNSESSLPSTDGSICKSKTPSCHCWLWGKK